MSDLLAEARSIAARRGWHAAECHLDKTLAALLRILPENGERAPSVGFTPKGRLRPGGTAGSTSDHRRPRRSG
jgi:hypothetical protein